MANCIATTAGRWLVCIRCWAMPAKRCVLDEMPVWQAANTTKRTDVPAIVGVSAPGFAPMEALSKTAMDAGAAGVMIAPTSNLRNDDQIINYYHNVAETVGEAPWVLQDFPLVTSVTIPTKVILKIVEDCPTCVMLKHEDWPGLEKISALRAASDAGARRISILCGNGALFLVEEMLRGADGAMTGFAYPEMMVSVVEHYNRGDVERGQDIFNAYLPLARFEQQPGMGLAIRKYILAKRGVIAHDALRKPGAGLSKESRVEVDRLIARQEKRLKELG